MKLSRQVLSSILHEPFEIAKGNLRSNCPWCGHREFDISYVKENHPYQCWRKKHCGAAGTIKTLLHKLNRTDLMIFKEEVSVNIDYSVNAIIENPAYSQVQIPIIKPPIGWQRVYKDEYLENRGFKRFDLFRVGVTKIHPLLKNYRVFLVDEDDQCRAWVARTIYDKQYCDKYKILRYRNSGDDFGNLLYGIDLINEKTEIVICVEGVMDKFNVDNQLNLYSQNEIVCVATFGNKITDIQIQKLLARGVKNILLMYDGDALNQSIKTSNKLYEQFDTLKVAILPRDKDPGDLNDSELWTVLENSKNYINFITDYV